jgi:hypothetical protein
MSTKIMPRGEVWLYNPNPTVGNARNHHAVSNSLEYQKRLIDIATAN